MDDFAGANFAGQQWVIFGAGYIGGAVAEQAVRRGVEVFALTRNTDRAHELEQRGVRVVVADLAEPEQWRHRLPERPHAVLNSVAAGGGGLAGYERSYVDGFRAILAWSTAHQLAGRLIYTSSTSVYPQGEGVDVDETAPTAARDERAGCLLAAEALALQWSGAVTLLRLAGIYGPGRHHLLDALRAGDAVLPGRGEQHLNLIHRDDAVGAILACLAAPDALAAGVFNVCDDHPTLKAEVIRWLAGRLARPIPAFSGETATGRRAQVPDRRISNRKLKGNVGWVPRYPDFRSGYEAILAAN